MNAVAVLWGALLGATVVCLIDGVRRGCWPYHVHRWEPRAVTHWSRSSTSIKYTTLLEQCRCGHRRQTEWDGERELVDFAPVRPAASDVVERELRALKPRGEEAK